MGGRGMMGSAGMGAAAGAGAGGAGPMEGSGGSPSIGSMSPTIPMVAGDCPEFQNGTITFMGLGGIVVSAGPKAAGPTAPMVFYWHGTGSVAGEYAGGAAPVNAGVVQEGGVLISFGGSTGGDLLSGTSVFGAGDFALTDQLVACAVRDHNIDPRRIFTTGCSAGGLFAAAMATQRSSYIAAAAPNSGGWTVPLQFQDAHIPALMTMHGAPGTDVVIIDFSDSSMTADTAFKGKGGFVINCNHGGGHCGGGGLSPDIWEFFKAHPFGVDPEPWTGGLPAGFSDVCKIY
jgi:poly(3-hydroxybutyrate) depolymerase